MLFPNHPALGAALSVDPLARMSPPDYRIMQPSPIRTFPVTAAPPTATPQEPLQKPVPPIEVGAPIQVSTGSTGGSSAAPASGALPIDVSNIIDPVTGVTYAGYLTQDAQTLYQSGSLLTGGNVLTPQGSALAAQGDLIQGTPAPSPAQFAQAQPAAAAPGTDFFSSLMNWLTEETLWSGVPNGVLAAGGVVFASWLLGGKKGRR
jgi:hypothetical protein